MAGSRISTFISEEWDPGAIQDWDALESPTGHVAPPFPPIGNPRRTGSDDPFHHSRTRSDSSTRSTSAQAPRKKTAPAGFTQDSEYAEQGHFFESPVTSPRLRPRILSLTEIPEASTIMSPSMPGFGHRDSTPRLARQNTTASAKTLPASLSAGKGRRDSDLYSVPAVPPMPPQKTPIGRWRSTKSEGQRSRQSTYDSESFLIEGPGRKDSTLLLDLDLSEYNKVRLDDAVIGASEKRKTQRQSMVGRTGGTIKRHIGTLLGTIKRPRHSRGDAEAGKGYSEIRGGEGQDEEAIGFDISSWGPEFAVPQPTRMAMEAQKMDPHKAYTETGEVIDLSDLVNSWTPERKDSTVSDPFPFHRAGTLENNSYYFAREKRDIPNWKAKPMHTWFIVMLLAISSLLIIVLELLYYWSNTHHFRKTHTSCPTEKIIPRLNDTEIASAHRLAEHLQKTVTAPGLWGFCEVADLSNFAFFTWKYIPTIIGVIYGILWKCTDTAIKRAEPYYQLSRGTKGALAARSLNIEYETFWSMFVPYAALKHRQWMVVSSSVASLLAFAIVPTLLSVVITTTPNQNQRQDWMNDASKYKYLQQYDIEKSIVIDSRYTRVSEGCLVVIILLGLHVLWKLRRRRSGLIGDPSGIAGVAAMANKSHILMDFKGLDMASEEKIHKQLNKRTYLLHKGALWQAELIKESERDNNPPKAMNAHPLLLRKKGMFPFMGFTMGVMLITPIMVYVPSWNNIINNAPWFVIGLSIVIKSLWEIVEKDMRMLEPFWLLYQGNADSNVLTLDYTATIPGAVVIKAAKNGHYLLAWVTFVTLLIEVLTVVMGSLDYTGPGGEESSLSFKMSFALTLIILGIILITMALLIYYRHRTFLPRQPGTISSVLAFIYQSKMLMHFEGTEEKSTSQRREQLKSTEKKYGFGWYLGRDGQRHLGIDQEPLLSTYKFGEDSKRGVVDLVSDWDRYEHYAT